MINENKKLEILWEKLEEICENYSHLQSNIIEDLEELLDRVFPQRIIVKANMFHNALLQLKK